MTLGFLSAPRTFASSSAFPEKFVFLLSAGPRDECPRTLSMLLVLSLLVHAGCNVGITASCDKDVGDVCVAELEEPVDTTIGT